MIERVLYDGRLAMAAYITSDFEPTDRASCDLIKLIFLDDYETIFIYPETVDATTVTHDAWDESRVERVPAGSPEGGQFGPGGGSGSTSTVKGKSKKPAKKEDFEKAKIRLGGTMTERATIEAWNTKIGIEPEEFKKTFLGGVDATMTVNLMGSGGKFDISGEIVDKDQKQIGSYTREIDPDHKSAYSAYFKLQRTETKGDIGKKVLGGNIEMYEALGIEKVKVNANIDVGGYAWAKYGYVPDQASWEELSGQIKYKLEGSSGGRRASSSSGNTMEADDWSMLGDDQQREVKDRWIRDTRQEFIDSEEQNWRDNGGALDEAKYETATNPGSREGWIYEAINNVRDTRDEAGDPAIPYSNEQLLAAITSEYETDGEGRNDPDIAFDDSKLLQPDGTSPGQADLPGIDPPDLSKRLTKDMREQLHEQLMKEFDKQAERAADDVEAPDYLRESVDEYQGEYWESMSERTRLEHAERFGLNEIEIEPDDDEESEQLELEEKPVDVPKTETDRLIELAKSDDPKTLWKIADSTRGKELLLNSSWHGVLNLKDPESMARFKAYVGRVKKDQPRAA